VAPNICALSMEVASCHPSQIHDSEMAPRFLENLCIPALVTLPPQMCHVGISDCKKINNTRQDSLYSYHVC